jgi:hypothetical protein
VGNGPQSLNVLKVQTYQSFIDAKAGGLDNVQSGSAWKKWSDPSHTYTSMASPAFTDTDAPEFVDRFPDAMPILYIRARVGASGVVTNNGNTTSYPATTLAAYDIRLLYPYTFPALTVPTTAPPPTGSAAWYFGTPAPNYDTPKQKDAYFLIAAGIDRKYGTADDVTNGGGF